MLKNQTKRLLQEGGMLQEGGSVDPVSGNSVPVGSMKEEVRDDIPAQLSEGEFVFPADVVRYIGLETLMKMRQAAKEGLKKMEAMGQMGNADEATMEDDGEFESEIDDILKEMEGGEEEEDEGKEKVEMAVGGMPMAPQPQQQSMPPAQMSAAPAPAVAPQEAEPNGMSGTEKQAVQGMQEAAAKPVSTFAPTQIIADSLTKSQASPERIKEVEKMMANVATQRAVMLRENDSVFIADAVEPGVYGVNTFSIDPPEIFNESVANVVNQFKKSNIKEIRGQGSDSQMVQALEAIGEKPEVFEGEMGTSYSLKLQ